MPPFLVHIPDGYGVIEHVFTVPTFDDEPMLMTLGFQLAGTDITVANVDEIHAAYGANFNAGTPAHGTEYQIGPFNVRYKKDGDMYEVPGTDSDGSSSGSSAVAPNTARLITKLTGLGGRRNKGRMYQPGPVETVVDAGGHFTAQSITDQQANADAYFDDLIALGSIQALVLFHSYDEADPPDPLPVPTQLTGFRIESKVATQRRRLRP